MVLADRLNILINNKTLAYRTPSAHVTRALSNWSTSACKWVSGPPPPPTLGLPVSMFALLSPGFSLSCPCDTNTCDFTSLCTVKQIPPTAPPSHVLKKPSAVWWGHPDRHNATSLSLQITGFVHLYLCGETKDWSVAGHWSAGCLLSSATGPTVTAWVISLSYQFQCFWTPSRPLPKERKFSQLLCHEIKTGPWSYDPVLTVNQHRSRFEWPLHWPCHSLWTQHSYWSEI